jgi:hypothetical protein
MISKSKKNSWDTPFQNACRTYIDPILCDFCSIEYQKIAYESWVTYTSKNVLINLCFEIPIFPCLSVKIQNKNGKIIQKIIKPKEISTDMVDLYKRFLNLDSSNLEKWTRNCQKGIYNDLINDGIEIIAVFLKECIAKQTILNFPLGIF